MWKQIFPLRDSFLISNCISQDNKLAYFKTQLLYDSYVYVPKKVENVDPHGNLYGSIHDGIICSSQKVEIIQVSISWWVDKQNMIYLYNGMLFDHIKE